MSHHVCKGGCGGRADEAGVCQVNECLNNGKPLETCDCADGSHGAGQADEPSSVSED